MRILCIGPLWRGSNAGGLFKAFTRQNCIVDVVDEFYYLSLQSKDIKTKVLEKLIRPLQVKEFNAAIKRRIQLFAPDILFVYKGAFLTPDTLEFAEQRKCIPVMFFPDVSTKTHGKLLPIMIPRYKMIYTTKTFGIKDLKDLYGVKDVVFIPHGFDPEIHRPLNLSEEDRRPFTCDVSFIGTWSPKKEQWLAELKTALPNVDLKIWGGQWNKNTTEAIKPSIQGSEVLGDLYALALQCTTVNLGILSEVRVGSSSGDLITSRTFHIPATTGLMLHERNEESLLYFKENEEAAFFEGTTEMIEKTRDLLANPALREKIKAGGYKRAWADHSLDERAKTIIKHLETL